MPNTALAFAEPPEAMPIWVRLKLAAVDIPFRKVTHFVRSSDGQTVIAAVDGRPVSFVKINEERS